MPEIETKTQEFEPIYLVIKTREEFDYLHGLCELGHTAPKNAARAYHKGINKDFIKILENYRAGVLDKNA